MAPGDVGRTRRNPKELAAPNEVVWAVRCSWGRVSPNAVPGGSPEHPFDWELRSY